MNTPASILVVDDEPSMLRYLQALLEVDSYHALTAGNGAEALACVQREPAPDLVLPDLLMPDMDGLQTLERLRQVQPGLRVVNRRRPARTWRQQKGGNHASEARKC